jgi:hypothetical protein
MAAKKTTKATDEKRFENNFPIESITVDKDLQPRVRLDSDAIADYKDVLFNGGELPPLELVQDGETYYLVDGFHRISSYKKLGILEVPANIRPGSRNDAIRAAIGANTTHGLRRSNPDKRRAVDMAFELMASEKANWTDTYIAELAGVSSMFVGNVRKERGDTDKSERTTPDGKTVTIAGRGRKTAALRTIDPEDGSADGSDTPEAGFKAVTGSKDKSGPLGVQVDRLINRVGALELAITELRGIFPNDYNLGEAIGANANLAVTFGKIRKRLQMASFELNAVPLPFEVTEDATSVAEPGSDSALTRTPEETPEPEEKPKAKRSDKPAIAKKSKVNVPADIPETDS